MSEAMVFPFGLFFGFGRDGARPSTIKSASSASQVTRFECWRGPCFVMAVTKSNQKESPEAETLTSVIDRLWQVG